jgi:hypothetical protein
VACQRAFSSTIDPDQGGAADAAASSLQTDRRTSMPTETIIVVSAVTAAFAFFAAVLTYADMTWSKSPQRKDVARR